MCLSATAGALPSFPSLTDDEAEAAVRRAREATERLQLLGRVRRQASGVAERWIARDEIAMNAEEG